MTDAVAPSAPRTSLIARAARSSGITMAGFVLQQALRLAANLILTRLLFPEAFGTMAIITVILMGLFMFSDMGTSQSIMGSKRGDDPDFLNTAWTIQIGRGVVLWLTACALAWPLSVFYDEPDLLLYLPVAGLTLLIMGFNPTRLETANRHLQAGWITLAEVGSQVLSLIVGVGLAWATGSIWSLVAANIVAALANYLLLDRLLPGDRNRLRWDPTAAKELIQFGKWIFLSTLCGFLIGQADKVVLGRALDLATFGLYNIAFFLASFPWLLGGMVMRRVLIPVYRESPPSESPANRLRLRRMRSGATLVLGLMVAVLAFLGVWLVDLMYDDRYAMAGGMVVLVAAVQVPALIILTCDQSALAAGDSRRFFVLTLARAVLVTGGILGGLALGGLPGALIGQGVGNLLAYPVLVWLVRPHGAWDPLHDGATFVAGALIGAAAIWYNHAAVAALWTI